MFIAFDTRTGVSTADVGGKAASLIRLRQAGFTVPPGLALTTRFFAPWLQQVQASVEWRNVLGLVALLGGRTPDLQQRARLDQACTSVKDFAVALALTTEQHNALAQALLLGAGPFAVRSSSPEEDTAGASFAGQYETVLDVRAADLESAIRTCFVSALDSRVLQYKLEQNFNDLTPQIAVVVQQLVQSETSGVAFSINPLTNDYDEVLINASWGLGEALVSGDITPDTYVVNAPKQHIVATTIGSKDGHHAQVACLDNEQLQLLATTVKEIESLYQMPIDVEWAFANGSLQVLQARPITTFVPLPEALQTRPGAARELYMDGYLTDGITMSGPITPISNDLFFTLVQALLEWSIGKKATYADLDKYGLHYASGRLYINISKLLPLIGSPERLQKQAAQMNPTVSAILTSPELEQYRVQTVPSHLRWWRLLPHIPRVLWRCRRAITVVVAAMIQRADFKRDYHLALAQFEQYIRRPPEQTGSIAEQLRHDLLQAGSATMQASYPAYIQAYFSVFRIKSLIAEDDPEQVQLVDALLSGSEDDMVVQMGHRIYEMAQMLPTAMFEDIDTLARRLVARDLPREFLSAWDEFIDRYGHRGPLEMDIINPRYSDSPQLLLQQIANLARAGGAFDPRAMLTEKVQAREAALAELTQILSPRKAKKLQALYTNLIDYSGAREYFKHHVTQIYQRTRQLVLDHAAAFVAANRLDTIEDVFQLRIEQIDQAADQPELDLRALVANQGASYRQQLTQVRHFPLAIDSRGRLFRPTLFGNDELPANTIAGAPVSSGVAIGPIKILNDPFEKDIEPGDILVAVTTDPGWTPLFINAAAIVLEIGGELQHGALVAREYGKPCVSGIADVTNTFTDGQIVRVDGDNGHVTIMQEASERLSPGS